MFPSLWIAKTGMEVQQTNLDIISNNLANVSTNGFKEGRGIFNDLLYQTLRQPGGYTSQQTQLPTGLQIGTGAQTVAVERLHTEGNLQNTGNDLDMAINGRGFFQVLMPDGTTAYTRDGAFQLDNQGMLVTAEGYQVQPAITIPSDALSVTVGKDGTVSVTQPGNPPATSQVGSIQLANFVNPAGLQSMGQNLYLETVASGAPQPNQPGTNGLGVIDQKYVETSNVNVAEQLVTMIQAQRAFELNSKAVTTSDQMLQRLTQL